VLTIGSRGSNLALAQTSWVQEQVLDRFPGLQVVVRIIRTSADRDTQTSIRAGSGTGVFVKEIEDALLAGEIDLAVHSMKDLPTCIPDDLEICAIPVREDVRDALIARQPARGIADLPAGAVIGTGSLRRHSQLLALRSDLRTLDIRGNIDTRLQKLSSGPYDAIILACAGLNRLRLQNRISFAFGPDQMLPAPGQGALALEMRKGDDRTAARVAALHHTPTAAAVLAERAFLRHMGGGCNTPLAALSLVNENRLSIEGLVAAPDGSKIIRRSMPGSSAQPETAGVELANAMLADGAGRILEALR
jgi:hydroxymethylbilane synthase